MMVFRLGAQDAPIMANQLGQDVSATDLVRLPNHNAYVQLMVDGTKSRTFSALTWPLDM